MSSIESRHNLSLGLCFFSAVFCVLCYAGVKGDVPWSTAEMSPDGVDSVSKVWYGLVGVKSYVKTAGVVTTDWEYTAYKDSGGEIYDDCATAGDVVISFATFGLIATAVTMLFAQKRKNSGGGGMTRLITMGAAGFAAFCAMTAWSTWVGECHEKHLNKDDLFPSSTGNDEEVTLHAGFAMAFLSMCFMGLTALNELCVPNDPSLQG